MEEAGARGIKEFGPLEISVPERIGGWCAGRGVEIDVHTTNLYRLERRKDFGRLKRMLAYSKRLLAGEYAVEEWLPDGGSGEQMRDLWCAVRFRKSDASCEPTATISEPARSLSIT